MSVPNLVTDFGAVGDDNTLNDAAIASWVAAAMSYGAGYAPGGTFRSATGIYIPAGSVRIYGDGMYATKFRTNNPSAITDGIAAVGASTQGNSLILEDLSVLAPAGLQGGNGIAIINNSRAIVSRCRIDGNTIGFWISNSFATLIEECYLTNTLGAALSYNNDNSANGASFNKNSVFACGNQNAS